MKTQIIVGMSLLVIAVMVLGNIAITWLFKSDTRRFRIFDVVKLVNNYRSSLDDPKLRQSLTILNRDASFYDAKVSVGLMICLTSSLGVAFFTGIFTHNLLAAGIAFVLGAVASIPLSSVLAKITINGAAQSEKEAIRSVLSMYLMVLGVELRTHPVEIALREMEEVTYSPLAFRITREIQDRISSTPSFIPKDGPQKDTSLAQAVSDLGKEWDIKELELIGETMRGSIFSPEALSDMILQQSRSMKQSILRAYGKKVEAQRPKLAMFSLLEVAPLMIFIILPVMSSFGKIGF